MYDRKYNFSPGPAVLPVPVLEKVRDNLLNYRGTGLGLMEMSHRGAEFEKIIGDAETLLRELLDIPESYKLLFTTGGATNQFSMIPMNLLTRGHTADFILTGMWSEKALEEAKKFGEVHVAASSKDKNFSYIPKSIQPSPKAAYLHYTSNNTIFGTQFQSEPVSGDVPLICDASSDLLHKKIDVTKYGVIYAGAQKNIGPAGVTLVVIREDLLRRSPQGLPILMDYNLYAKERSLYNTPPTLAIYVVKEVLAWLKEMGGLDEMARRNREKAAVLYQAIDAHPCYVPHAEKDSRSVMNVTFKLSDPAREPEFLKEAAASGLLELKGHRIAGGFRASIYNAFPLEGVKALAAFMNEFAARMS